MRKYAFAAVAALGLAGIVQSAIADDYINLSSLSRDVVASSPGDEIIVPYYLMKDTDADGIPDTLVVRFKVYAGGTKTLLHSSAVKSVTLLVMPCVNPMWRDDNMFEPKFLGKDGSPRAHMGIGMYAECQENDPPYEYKRAGKTFIYSADVSKSGGSVWAYAVNREMTDFSGVDVDNDGNNEAMLVTEYTPDPANPWYTNIVVRIMNFGTGALISQQEYQVVR